MDTVSRRGHCGAAYEAAGDWSLTSTVGTHEAKEPQDFCFSGEWISGRSRGGSQCCEDGAGEGLVSGDGEMIAEEEGEGSGPE